MISHSHQFLQVIADNKRFDHEQELNVIKQENRMLRALIEMREPIEPQAMSMSMGSAMSIRRCIVCGIPTKGDRCFTHQRTQV